MNRFLDSLPPAERARILDLTAAVTADLGAWGRAHPVLAPVRFPAIAISMAAAAPHLQPAQLALMARIPAWIYAIDDAFDRGDIPAAERAECVRRYTALARGEPVRLSGGRERDACGAPLAEVVAALRARPLWGRLGPAWGEACRRMLQGMAFECDAAEAMRAGVPPPALHTYLRHARYSIGVHPFVTAAWMLEGDPRGADHLPALQSLARAAGLAVRLANDLRTHEKECEEGNLNALMLLAARTPDAEAAVRSLLHRAMGHLQRRAAPLQDLPAVRLTTRVAAFAVDLYAEHDYHTIPHGQILPP